VKKIRIGVDTGLRPQTSLQNKAIYKEAPADSTYLQYLQNDFPVHLTGSFFFRTNAGPMPDQWLMDPQEGIVPFGRTKE